MGFREFCFDLCYWPYHRIHGPERNKQFKDGFCLQGMKGATDVEVDRKQNKLTVSGNVDPNKVLQRVRHQTGKKADFWPYVPYDVIPHPYAPGAYDKKAPPGYVRNVLENPEAAPEALASPFEVKLTSAFSDDNPSACVIM